MLSSWLIRACGLEWVGRLAKYRLVARWAFKKRQTTDPATSADICCAYNSHSVIIYSRAEKSCLDTISNCAFDYYLYSVSGPTGVPLKICNGNGCTARSKVQPQPPAPSLSPSPRPPAEAQMKILSLYMLGFRRKFPAGYRAGA